VQKGEAMQFQQFPDGVACIIASALLTEAGKACSSSGPKHIQTQQAQENRGCEDSNSLLAPAATHLVLSA
jgi:hypothetical protein